MTKPKSARATLLAVLLAVLLAGLALAASACTSSGGKAGTGPSSSDSGTSVASTAPSSTSTSTTPPRPKLPVHLTAFPDGNTVGVGMPIIVTFNKKIAEAHDFVKNTKVTVNGKPASGAWYFEYSARSSGHLVEAHYRELNYWPAHAQIHVAFNLKGVSAGTAKGKDLVYDGKLTSIDFQTGPANIGVVDDTGIPHTLTITSDGKFYGKFPVSLGATRTPTRSGVKVIMEQLPTVCMHDAAGSYYECGIKFDQRLTYDGEYLHSAPWNVGNIDNGVDTSNGCTNLLPNDAEKLYHFLHIGDVIKYPNVTAGGSQRMGLGDGYGDWNVNWGEWQTGGAFKTT